MSPEELPLETLLETRFISARCGLFDLRMPVPALAKKRTAREFIGLVRATLEAQVAWLDWMGESASGGEELQADFALILKDFKHYRPDAILKGVKTDERDFFAIVGASDKILPALERVAIAMGTGAPLGLERENTPAQLVLIPDRKQFVEFVAYVGWSDETKKPHYWVDGTEVWMECFIDQSRAACLEYPAVNRGDYTAGTRMNEKNPKEMEQQVTQIAAMSLFDNYYGGRLPAALVGGLANNLVIEVFGEVDTRLDGSVKSNQTFARSVFIPGGNSEGGFLGKQSAENRWRSNAGRLHFLKVLKSAQKLGKSTAKKEKHKYKSFLLMSQDESQRYVVKAPIFGTPSIGNPTPPPGVYDDYLEFLRAYKSGFLFWMQTQIDGKKKSPARFAEFLAELSRGEPKDFEQAIKDFYGMPLSSTELGKEDLEGRFLKFLSK